MSWRKHNEQKKQKEKEKLKMKLWTTTTSAEQKIDNYIAVENMCSTLNRLI